MDLAPYFVLAGRSDFPTALPFYKYQPALKRLCVTLCDYIETQPPLTVSRLTYSTSAHFAIRQVGSTRLQPLKGFS